MKVMRFLSSIVLLTMLMLAPALYAKGPITDDHLYDQVRIQIAGDREIGGNPIDVKVDKGAVELTGKVRTEKQKEKAGKIAKKVKGVKSVTNSIMVSPT